MFVMLSEETQSKGPVASPFSQVEGYAFSDKKKIKVGWLLFLGAMIVACLCFGSFLAYRYLSDPLRTLEPFPVGKYLDGYKSLAGSRFRADLRVENDLGYKDGVGRLMTFTLRDDSHPVVVMIPPSLAQIYFTKGQNYQAAVEVKEGGLIYANICRKN